MSPSGDAVAAAGPVYTYAFKTKQGRVKGELSEFMEGIVTLAADGVHLQGKAMLPASQRAVGSLFGALGGAIAASVRVNREDRLPWECVNQIVLEPAKQRICLVYHLPGKPKKLYSHAFLVGDLYANFEQAARYYGRDKVTEGKIGPATPLWVWITFVLFMAFCIWILSQGGGHSHR